MVDIKIFGNNEKIENAYNELLNYLNQLCEDYQLTYFELWGILKAVDNDYIKSNLEEDD